ncbi:MAG: ribosome rescue protein RqcH [Fervidicoccaceae archaeon]|jgi:predicted ribosome quality control (RQC) complex YloA/Tae2 family protein
MEEKQKKSMTSVDVKAWIEETKDSLIGTRIHNIYVIQERKIILFKVKIADYKYLLIEPGKRIHLTRSIVDIPETPNVFATSLRKYLRDQTIEGIKQIGFDRILKINFKNGYSIYVELLPRGEAILVDNEEKILQATEFKSMKDREIKRGQSYVLPPVIQEVPSQEECEKRIMEGKKLALSRELGIPPEILNEAEKRGKSSSREVCAEILKIIEASGKNGGFILVKNNNPISFHPFPPTIGEDEEALRFEKFNDAIDEFYFRLSSISMGKELSDEEQKISKMIDNVSREIEEYEKRSKELYEIAELLMSNLNELRELKECIERVRKKVGWDGIRDQCPGITDIDPNRGRVKLNIENKEIELPVNLDPYIYVQELFEEGKKLRKKAESAKQHLLELKDRLKREAEKREQRIEEMKVAYRKRSWYEKFRWTITRNGFLVIAGRDVQQNTTIVKKYLKREDIYLHADIHGASSTIMITEGKAPLEEDIYDAAILAASYSKGWNIGLPAVDVFWVKGEQVSLSPPSGEFLAKGSFMIYGQKNYIKAVPLVLHLGIQTCDDGTLRPFVGSEEAVKKYSIPLAILMPGEASPEEAIKKIINIGKEKGFNLLPLSEELKKVFPGKTRIKAILNNP